MRDLDIRAQLHRRLYDEHREDDDTLVLDEIGLCAHEARVDVAVINGQLHGYEIKSDRDTLARLPRQLEVYARTLDRLTFVVGAGHAGAVRDAVPDWCGVLVATEQGDGVRLEETQPTGTNPQTDPYSVAQLLWRDEALEVLRRRGCDRGVRSKPRPAVWRRLADAVPAAELAAEVRACLKARYATGGWRSGDSRR